MAKQSAARNEAKSQPGDAPIKVMTVNRQAYHDYFVERTVEAGISLVGTEIKSIREGKVNLRGAYAIIRNGELWLENANITVYEHRNRYHHHPTRSPTVLLHRRQQAQLAPKLAPKG